jgi:hypothetical protein
VIGDLLPPDCTARAIRERFEEWQRKISGVG